MSVVQKFVVVFDFLAIFIITRYPYLEIFLLFMSMSDADGRIGAVRNFTESLQQRENVIVYIHAAVYFLCATGMTLDIKKRHCGFVAFIHLAIVTAFSVISNGSRWPETLTVRVISRAAGVGASYLFVIGGLTDSKQRQLNMTFLQTARQIFSAILFCNAYFIWVSNDDRLAHTTHLPGGKIVLVFMVVVYVVCALCIYGGYEAGYFGRLVAWQLLLVTVFVDSDTKFWLRSNEHIKFWMQMLLASRNLPIIAGLLLLDRKRHW